MIFFGASSANLAARARAAARPLPPLPHRSTCFTVSILAQISQMDRVDRPEDRGNAGWTADSYFHPSRPSGFGCPLRCKKLISRRKSVLGTWLNANLSGESGLGRRTGHCSRLGPCKARLRRLRAGGLRPSLMGHFRRPDEARRPRELLTGEKVERLRKTCGDRLGRHAHRNPSHTGRPYRGACTRWQIASRMGWFRSSETLSGEGLELSDTERGRSAVAKTG